MFGYLGTSVESNCPRQSTPALPDSVHTSWSAPKARNAPALTTKSHQEHGPALLKDAPVPPNSCTVVSVESFDLTLNSPVIMPMHKGPFIGSSSTSIGRAHGWLPKGGSLTALKTRAPARLRMANSDLP